MELANAYSEQNNFEKQAEAFKQQGQFSATNDDELCRNDADFVEALSYGMPPTAGWGCGIDRVCMMFTGA